MVPVIAPNTRDMRTEFPMTSLCTEAIRVNSTSIAGTG